MNRNVLFLLIFFWIFLVVFNGSVAFCQDEKLPVVASIFPIADMVKQIGGDYVDVVSIIPPGASPHTFSLKPSQVRKIAGARIYFAIGAGLEQWADKFILSSADTMIKVVLSDNVPLMYQVDAHHHGEDHSPDAHSDMDHGYANPHIWLDPLIAITITEKIEKRLSQIDVTNRIYYENNGKAYRRALYLLDERIRKTISGFQIKKYVSFHSAWAYFAKRYGLESVGVIEGSPGRDPTPKAVMDILEQIKKYHIRAVFAEPQFNPKIATVIAKEAGARVLFLDPIGSPDFPGRDTYIHLMDYNLGVLKEAMK